MKKDIWHFPRTTLAKRIVNLLDTGLANRLTLVAPRRKGKTEFLIQDVAPVASKAGYRVVYASLWDNVDAPHHGLMDVLSASLAAYKKHGKNAAKEVLNADIHRLKVGALGIGAEMEFAQSPVRVDSSDLQKIGTLINTLAEGKNTRLLLILDEIQHIGTSDAFAPLAYRLKSVLDEDKSISVIFSGSSRHGIRQLFGDMNAPLFGISTEMPLEDMDADFTQFLAKTFERVTQRTIDPDTLWRWFNKLDKNPFYLREALKLMVLEPGLSSKAATQRIIEAVANENDYPGRWAGLSDLDKALFLRIARHPNASKLHTKEFTQELTNTVGTPVSPNLVARRLQRLVEQNFVSPKQRGAYVIEMPGFAEWVLSQEDVE